jgi:phospholipase C
MGALTLTPSMRRRPARLAMSLALVVAVACTSHDPPPIPTADPAGRPEPVDATSFQTRWPIKHVVFVIKENRSFDNLFGLFPGANGAAFGSDDGAIRTLEPAVDETPHDLLHTYDSGLEAINGGRMDGFSQSPNSRRYAYTAFRPEAIPNYWAWAERYVLGDNFFASVQGPSFPNHLFTIAATSGGTRVNPEQPPEQVTVLNEAGFSKSWGCDISPDGFVVVLDSEGEEERVPPCFDFLTEGDLLDDAGIPWSYYAASNTQNGYVWSAYSAIGRYRNDPVLWGQHVFPVDAFEQDVRDGRLAPVTWVTPTHELSDHPEHSMCQGENWTTRVVNAVMRSPSWKDTAIFITWDDWGGFYDHVPPRQIDPFGYGIRVPLLVISPYARAGFVDHTEAEFSSVLRFIEDNWGLTQLTDRDRLANDLSYDFDFAQDPRPPDPLPLRTCVNAVDPSPIEGD